jgi:hypothetical protein
MLHIQRSGLHLSEWPPELSDEATAQISARLLKGCVGCPGMGYARLCRREYANGSLHIYLQCLTCGDALGSPFGRADHPEWLTYPEFDEDLQQLWRRYQRDEDEKRRLAWFAEEEARREKFEAQYDTPEWRKLAARVMARAGGRCEYNSSHVATVVHHETYLHGILAPERVLVALCEECHKRCHDPHDEWFYARRRWR